MFNSIGPGYAVKWQFSFQDPASPIMEGIIHLHNDLLAFMVGISIFVTWMLYRTVIRFQASENNFPNFKKNGLWVMPENATILEIIWTIAPSFILLAIAVPSFALLYAMDEVIDPSLTIKAVGHQWYWSYEYSDYDKSINFDSYMKNEDDLVVGDMRLLEVDHRVVLPINTHIRVIVTSADVLHSWAIPALGVKMDACPGRLNQTSLFIKRTGLFYGQCSEICGANHAFMPIVIEAVDLPSYVKYIQEQ
jgi:cytochrome c oxidase subunit 2